MLCQGKSNFKGLICVATREVISRYIDYTRQVRDGDVNIKCATTKKNNNERSRCITNFSLLEPLLMAMTRLAPSH